MSIKNIYKLFVSSIYSFLYVCLLVRSPYTRKPCMLHLIRCFVLHNYHDVYKFFCQQSNDHCTLLLVWLICLYRVESFIEHQDACIVRRVHPDRPTFPPACSSSTSPSSDTNLSAIASFQRLTTQLQPSQIPFAQTQDTQNNLELQLLPSSSLYEQINNNGTNLKLSIGSAVSFPKDEEKMKMALVEKEFADEARQQAKRQIETAELEFANAKRIRKQAQAELERAKMLREQASMKISSTMLEITCHSCRQRFQASRNNGVVFTTDEMSSAITEGEGSEINL